MIEVGDIIKDVYSGEDYEVVSLQGYMNYGVGIEQLNHPNPDTCYIKLSEIGVNYFKVIK